FADRRAIVRAAHESGDGSGEGIFHHRGRQYVGYRHWTAGATFMQPGTASGGSSDSGRMAQV
ncbi:hypothetical protein PMAYCL1PPCAC_05740, partial [Pristionchus mayeri]